MQSYSINTPLGFPIYIGSLTFSDSHNRHRYSLVLNFINEPVADTFELDLIAIIES